MHLFSFRLDIFIFFRMLRQIFLSCLASFSTFFRPLAKNNLLFFHPDHPFSEIFSLRRNNFSCLFPSGTEKFFCPFRYFLLSWNFFKRKIRFFRFPLPSFRHFFLAIGIIFMFFPVQGKKFFSPFSSFSYFSRGFSKEKSLFPGMNFPSERTFFPFLGEYFRIFFVSSDKESHPSRGIFRPIRQEFSPFRLFSARPRRARTCTRVIIY